MTSQLFHLSWLRGNWYRFGNSFQNESLGRSRPLRFLYTALTLAFVMGMLLAIVAGFAMTAFFIRALESSSYGIEREIHSLPTMRRNLVSRIDDGVVQVGDTVVII